jgi:hypothetical protein
MRRREFIALLGGAAATWPLAARAQQATKIPRVGILSPAGNEAAATLAAFRKGIRDLGISRGRPSCSISASRTETSMPCRRWLRNSLASRSM